MSIKKKFLCIFIPVFALCGFFIWLIIYYQNSQILSRHIRSDLDGNLDSSQQIVDSYISLAETTISHIAQDPVSLEAILNKDPRKLNQISRQMTEVLGSVGVLENITLNEVDGQTCMNVTTDEGGIVMLGRDLSGRDYCKGILQSRSTYISSAFLSSVNNRPVLALAVPVNDSKGQLRGFVAGNINLSFIRGSIWDLKGENRVDLIDRNGVVFLNTEKIITTLDSADSIGETDELELSTVQRLLAAKSTRGSFFNGNYLVGYNNTGPFTIVYEKSTADLYGLIASTNRSIVWAMIFAEFLISLLVYFLISRITRRVYRVSQVAREAALGNSKARLDESDLQGNDEVSILARAFDTMTSNLWAANRNLGLVSLKNETMLESIADGVVAMDVNWNVTLWNRAAETITGFTKDETMGRPIRNFLKLLRERDRKENVVFLEEALLYGKEQKLTDSTVLIDKQGVEKKMQDAAAPILNEDGGVSGVIIVFRDISRESVANRLNSDYAYAAHQIRTPVVKALGYLEIAQETKNLEEVTANVTIARKAMASVQQTAEKLIAVAEVDSGQVEPDITEVNLSEIIDSVLKSMYKNIDSDKLKIGVKNELGANKVLTSERLVRRILVELISNAINYSNPGGKIDINIRHAFDTGSIILKIANLSGVGIRPEEAPIVFTKFFRGTNFNSTEIAGAGLGLYIVREYAKLLGGKIWFESKDGESTTFYVELPYKESKK